jgi:hypothetical protein
MFNYKMDLRCYFTCLHVLELLLFIAAIIIYDIYLSYMLVLFGIRIFNLFKSEGSMSLISLNLQHIHHQVITVHKHNQFITRIVLHPATTHLNIRPRGPNTP